MAELEKRRQRKIQSQKGGLIEFVRYFWDVLEPTTELVEGWVLDAICEHLEAVTFGEINRLLINVPPGFMKSLLTDVFWPAWEWSAMNMASTRYVAFSYAATLTQRDNGKFRDLLLSQKFRELWGSKFAITTVGVERVANDRTGWKFASSVGGVGTGERGDRVILDDPHNIKEAESDQIRSETVRWFRESMSNRLNDMNKSAIVVIMQRVHENDVSGAILSEGMDYVHLMVPMEFDSSRVCSTAIGWTDPRLLDEGGEELSGPALDAVEGELAWPERFSAQTVEDMKRDLGPYAFAGQYQQSPVPRGGGLFKPAWWKLWEPPDGKWPSFDFVLASVDSAFTAKEENDPTGMTVWGVFSKDDRPQVMLVKAWRKHLEFGGGRYDRLPNETNRQFLRRTQPDWGLVEWIAETCRFRDRDGKIIGTVDALVIEAKASGISAAQAVQKLYGDEGWITHLMPVKGDKVARAQAVIPVWSNGQVWAPDREWADLVIREMEIFPKGRYKDLTDSATQAIKWLRDQGMLRRNEEIVAEENRAMTRYKKQEPLYHV